MRREYNLIREKDGVIHLPTEEYLQEGNVVRCTARQICMHVLGLDHGSKVYRRGGKTYCKAYRNYFGGHSDILDELVAMGYMTGSPSEKEPEEGNYWYHFTDAGLSWMAKELGYEKITVE